MKKAILILGMHRSGTSVQAGMFNMLGAFQGDHLIPPNPDNMKGFFENIQINRLNNYILSTELNGLTWDTVRAIDIDQSDHSRISALVKYILFDVFGDRSIISIKDPRICLLLPYYETALQELGFEIYYVRTFRPPAEIINSLMKRDHFTYEKSKDIIHEHDLGLSKLPSETLTIKYNDVLAQLNSTIDRIKQNMPFLDFSEVNIQRIHDFVDISLKHH